MSSKLDDAIKILRELIDLEQKQIATQRQMLRLLLIANTAGLDLKDIKSKRVGTSLREMGYTPMYAKPWLTTEFIVTVDGEEVFRDRLKNVPEDLWPADMRAEKERRERRVIPRV